MLLNFQTSWRLLDALDIKFTNELYIFFNDIVIITSSNTNNGLAIKLIRRVNVIFCYALKSLFLTVQTERLEPYGNKLYLYFVFYIVNNPAYSHRYMVGNWSRTSRVLCTNFGYILTFVLNKH